MELNTSLESQPAIVNSICPCVPSKTVMLPLTGFGLGIDTSALECGPSREEIIQLIREELTQVEHARTLDYFLCWHIFKGIHPTPKQGMVPVDGTLITDAAATYPQAFAYLQTEEGQMLCTDEASWQAASHAHWATLADGTTVGWEGVGGICKYVIDTDAGTIRVPDLRGMYAEVAGFDTLEVGGVHGDAMREMAGYTSNVQYVAGNSASGVFFLADTGGATNVALQASGSKLYQVGIQASRSVPVAAKNQPRAWGSLACVYLGLPDSPK